MALKGQYIHTSKDQGTITALKKNFTFGGCCGLERSIHMNKLQ